MRNHVVFSNCKHNMDGMPHLIFLLLLSRRENFAQQNGVVNVLNFFSPHLAGLNFGRYYENL